jgi:hypothetical protein
MADVWHTVFGVAGASSFSFSPSDSASASFFLSCRVPWLPSRRVSNISCQISLFVYEDQSYDDVLPILYGCVATREQTLAVSAKDALASRRVPFLPNVPCVFPFFSYAHSLSKLLAAPFQPVTDLLAFEGRSIFTCLAPLRTIQPLVWFNDQYNLPSYTKFHYVGQ